MFAEIEACITYICIVELEIGHGLGQVVEQVICVYIMVKNQQSISGTKSIQQLFNQKLIERLRHRR